MARTRVKICGITRAEDALRAADHGADSIGLNVFAGSRKISPEAASAIYWSIKVPSYPQKGFRSSQTNLEVVVLCGISREVFPDAIAWHEFAAAAFVPHVYQIYGDRPEEMVALTGLRQLSKWWQVVPVSDRGSISQALVKVRTLKCPPTNLLLDAASEGRFGGTGRTFAWEWIAMSRNSGELDGLPPIILAGGLTPDNVAEAIRIARPYAVDVSSGVEVPGKPGIKDPIKMRDFIQAAQSA